MPVAALTGSHVYSSSPARNYIFFVLIVRTLKFKFVYFWNVTVKCECVVYMTLFIA